MIDDDDENDNDYGRKIVEQDSIIIFITPSFDIISYVVQNIISFMVNHFYRFQDFHLTTFPTSIQIDNQ
ncbi:hypothetical protein DERF_011309 [Dermatophagoides farinae]|uniref:Uncharacterized protein n=1 Tax=Dermatophagoides farinae TaxID=6954 RepID=A0A922HRZ2_DERFA|nr:hypothetical protein DERF_011309 [Dermatophagoides farinae]